MCRILAVVYSYYPYDVRVRRESEALVEAGNEVDVVCLQKSAGEPVHETVNGVDVYRLPLNRKRGGKFSYISRYVIFLFLAFLKVTSLHLMRRYKIIHTHNMPDFLVFCALLPKATGASILLDLHDPMPEVFMTKFSMDGAHPAIGLLRLLERASIKFSDAVITPNKSFMDVFVKRGCPEDKIRIVMNSPDESIFSKDLASLDKKPSNGGFNIMYHGTIVERHGLDVALKAVHEIKKDIHGLAFHVYGEGEYVGPFQDMVKDLGLSETVFYHRYVPLEVIAKRIAQIDVGIVPNKLSVFTNLNLPTRIFEYLSLEKPVIVPSTRGVLEYFDGEGLFLFEPGNSKSLSNAILEVVKNKERRQKVLENGMKIYDKYRWTREKARFINLIEELSTARERAKYSNLALESKQ